MCVHTAVVSIGPQGPSIRIFSNACTTQLWNPQTRCGIFDIFRYILLTRQHEREDSRCMAHKFYRFPKYSNDQRSFVDSFCHRDESAVRNGFQIYVRIRNLISVFEKLMFFILCMTTIVYTCIFYSIAKVFEEN